MINIVHFGKYYWPDNGGIESVTCSLAQGAAAAGHPVSVVCFEKKPVRNFDFINGVKIIREPILLMVASQPLGFRYFIRCLSAAKKADLVHLHFPNMLGALCALLISRKTHLLVHWHSDVINKGFLGKLFRPLEFALLCRADSIIATSQVYADASESLASFRGKISVVPIGVPGPKHESNNMVLPHSIEERVSGKKIVLAVGRLVHYKGFDVLIEAAKLLSREAVVVIVGGGPLEQDLLQAMETGGVVDRVVMAGRLSDAVLHALFLRATLFCLPSTYRAEAFGVVLLEAMAYGLPIVSTNILGSGVPIVNQHGISGLNVPVDNSIALAEACNQILCSEDLRKKLSSGARQRFLSEFTEDISVKRIIAVYERLVFV